MKTLLLALWVVCGCRVSSVTTYRVEPSEARLVIDGVLDERVWDDAALETGFDFPWQERAAPPTEFRALHDGTFLYFAFEVVDADIVIADGDDEEAVARGDRVELFFTSDASLDDYICFEIDPDGRVLDYRAAHYREFDFEWDSSGVVVATARTETGYLVEGKIPRAGLPALTDGASLLTGVFRAEYSHRAGDEPPAEWISWVAPDSAEPDFHIPSAFGRFELR